MTQRYINSYSSYQILISGYIFQSNNLSGRMLQCTENLTFYLSTAQTAHKFRITSKATFKMGIGTNQKG